MQSNITPGHVRAFQAVTRGIYGEVTLCSCQINGEAGVAIALVDHAGEGKVAVMPLFVAITESMELVIDGESSREEEGGGGPKADEKQAAREFRAGCRETTSPAPQ